MAKLLNTNIDASKFQGSEGKLEEIEWRLKMALFNHSESLKQAYVNRQSIAEESQQVTAKWLNLQLFYQV